MVHPILFICCRILSFTFNICHFEMGQHNQAAYSYNSARDDVVGWNIYFFYDFTTEVDIIFLYYLYGENSIKKVLRTCKQQSVA